MTKPRRHDDPELADEQKLIARLLRGEDPPRRRAGHRGSLDRIEASEQRRAAESDDDQP